MTDSKSEHDKSGIDAMPSPNTAGQSPMTTGHPGEHGSSSAIGRRLKAYYEDVASEPIPDRFLSLLDALDAVERNTGHRSDS